MSRAGYIESVVIDESLDSVVIAASCHMPEWEYKCELDAAIASILHFSNERHREAEITLLGEKGEDPFDSEDDCAFQLMAKIDKTGRGLMFEFMDKAKPDEKKYIGMPFRNISRGLGSYRKHLDNERLLGKSTESITFFDTIRLGYHEDAAATIGLNPWELRDSARVTFDDHMAKYLVTLVIALFPQGPHADWKLAPALPASGVAKPNGFEAK